MDEVNHVLGTCPNCKVNRLAIITTIKADGKEMERVSCDKCRITSQSLSNNFSFE